MKNGMDWRQSDAFLVKVFRGVGDLHGFVQYVRTGEKSRFQGLDGLGEAIARLRYGRRDDPRRQDGKTRPREDMP